MPRTSIAAIVLFACLQALSVAQTETLHELRGGTDDAMGAAVAHAGDVDHDGYDDFVVGAPGFGSSTSPSGRVEVRSGHTGAVLWSKVGSSGDGLGLDVAGGLDVDGDGTPDFAGGFNRFDSNHTGGVIVWSGATGQVLMSQTTTSGLGFSVDFAGDLDGDGRSEVLVGAPETDIFFGSANVGRFRVWKLDTASTNPLSLVSVLGSALNGRLGRSVANAGDVDHDGVCDIAVGEPGYSFTLTPLTYTPGRVRIYSGQAAGNGQAVLIRQLEGSDLFNRIGFVVDAGRDIDGDGTPDLIAGSETEGCEVFSGDDGSSIFLFSNFSGTDPGVGRGVAIMNDLNGDGRAEFAYSTFDNGDSEVRVADGASAMALHTLPGSTNSGFGAALASGCDLTGDGQLDLLVGAPDEDNTGGLFLLPDAGAVRAFPFSPAEITTGFGLHGMTVTTLPDIDGDGLRDLAIANTAGQNGGFVEIRSSAPTLPFLAVANGPDVNDGFGQAVLVIDDEDGDGRPDIVIGAPFEDYMGSPNTGRIHIHSSLIGGPLRSIDSGAFFAPSMEHGASLARLPDLDNDGRPEIAAGAPRGRPVGTLSPHGIVLIHSGATGAVIGALGGLASGELFGEAIAAIPDVTGDGLDELAVCAPNANALSGRLDVFDGSTLLGIPSTPVKLFTIHGPSSSQFGSSVAAAGDVNGDGTQDVIVGAPFQLGGNGFARVYCGLTGTQLLQVSGRVAADLMGTSVAGAGDMNGDGLDDVIVGAPGDLTGFPAMPTDASFGRVLIVSGNGDVLREFRGEEAGALMGETVARLDDIDGDGFDEIAFTTELDLTNALRSLTIAKPRRLTGIEAYGDGTPGCNGVVRLLGNSPPRIGNTGFAIITDNAPPLSSSVTLLAESAARVDPGLDLFGLGLVFHLDPTTPTGATAVNTVTDATGFATIPAPLPNLPVIAGFQLVLQGIWFEGPCQPGFGYSMTNGLELTLLP